MATATLLLAATSLALAYGLGLIVFRLLFHPLARVPGPKIAAITGWYEFYWDCPKSGQYVFRIRDMHRRYGPIVRISPREVHIDDPAFFDTFYSNSKLDKDAWFYRAFGDNGAAVGTASWEQHKARRGAMAKFFSSANVAKLALQDRKIKIVQTRPRDISTPTWSMLIANNMQAPAIASVDYNGGNGHKITHCLTKSAIWYPRVTCQLGWFRPTMYTGLQRV
ncbi:hypothetical protein NU219Hw_g4981t1 [Hortaea werneckii]